MLKMINKKIEDSILELLEKRIRSMSIKEITEELEKNYNIKKSPQIIKRHLKSLIDKGEIKEIKNAKKKI